jgi:hypothetical protein
MSNNIVLNSSNALSSSKNVFVYNFINGNFKIPKNSTIAIKQVTIPYSWYNISQYLGNNTFQYTMPTSGTSTNTVTVTIPDGFYTISDLNNILQESLFANNYFFYNSSSSGASNPEIIYPISFSQYSPQYTNQIEFQYIPTSSNNVIAQFGFNWNWALATYPSTATCPSIIITGNVNSKSYLFGNVIGFLSGTYGGNTYPSSSPTILDSQPVIVYGNTLTNSNFPALGSNVNGIVVRCNLINNSITMPSDILDSFPINAQFGSNINYLPQNNNKVLLKEGNYNSIQFSLFDQNLNPLLLQDTNVLISIELFLGKE